MACPKCGKCVPKRYRESHAMVHLDAGDVKYVSLIYHHYKNSWEALKHSVKVEEDNKKPKPKRKLR